MNFIIGLIVTLSAVVYAAEELQPGAPWPRYGNSYGNDFVSQFNGRVDPAGPIINWVYTLPGSQYYSGLSLTANGLLVAVSIPNVYCYGESYVPGVIALDVNGNEWFQNNDVECNAYCSSVAVGSSNSAYFSKPENTNSLYTQMTSIELLYGKTEWTSSTNSRFSKIAASNILNGAVFDGSAAYDPQTGQKLWSLAGNSYWTYGQYINGPAIYEADGVALYTAQLTYTYKTSNASIIAVNATNGQLIWAFPVVASIVPVVDSVNKLVYVAAGAYQQLQAVHIANGSLAWTSVSNVTLIVVDVLYERNRLFVVRCLVDWAPIASIVADTGDTNWMVNTFEYTYYMYNQYFVSMIASNNSILYLMTLNGTLCSYNADNGQLFWCHGLFPSTPYTSGLGGSLIMGIDGTLYASGSNVVTSCAYFSSSLDLNVKIFSINTNQVLCSPGAMYMDGTCTLCSPGTYSPSGAYCLLNDYGTYTSTYGATEPVNCPVGTYSKRQSPKCINCPTLNLLLTYLIPTLQISKWNLNEGSSDCPFIHLDIPDLTQILIVAILGGIVIVTVLCTSDRLRASFAFIGMPTTSAISNILNVCTLVFYNQTIMYCAVGFLFVDFGVSFLMTFCEAFRWLYVSFLLPQYQAQLEILRTYNSEDRFQYYAMTTFLSSLFTFSSSSEGVEAKLPFFKLGEWSSLDRALLNCAIAAVNLLIMTISIVICLIIFLACLLQIMAIGLINLCIGIAYIVDRRFMMVAVISAAFLVSVLAAVIMGIVGGIVYKLELTSDILKWYYKREGKEYSDDMRRRVQNSLLLGRLFLESIPQFVITIDNNTQLGVWSFYSIITVTITGYMIARTLYAHIYCCMMGKSILLEPTNYDQYIEFETSPVDFLLKQVGCCCPKKKNTSEEKDSEKKYDHDEKYENVFNLPVEK